jgi:hypothetical protein
MVHLKIMMRTFMQQQMKLFFIGVTMLFFLTISCTQNVENNSTMKKDSTMPAAETERLLTVVSLNKISDGPKIEVTFLESPAVFEFILVTTQDSMMYILLSDSKAKQLPVNVFIVREQNRKLIKKVLPATKQQITNYLKERNEPNPATPVPKPDSM